MKPTPFARKLLRVLLIVLLVLVGVHLVMQLLNLQVYHEKNGFVFEMSNRLDMDDEVSLPTWVASMLLCAVGASGLIAAYLERVSVKRRLWGLIGIMGVFMSLDEVASTHEFVLQSLHNIFFLDTSPQVGRNAWWLVAPLIVAVGLWLAWQAARQFSKRTFVLLCAGGVIMLGGAVVIDVLAAAVVTAPFMHQGVLVAIEEGCELLGTIIILYAIVSHIERTHGAEIARAKQQLKQ